MTDVSNIAYAHDARRPKSGMKFVLASWGTRGDGEPCAAVCRELLRRGHEVRMAVAPVADRPPFGASREVHSADRLR